MDHTPQPAHSPPPDAAQPSGLAPNVAGALAYLFGPITGVLFLVIGRDRFVRFHAVQSIGISVAWVALAIVLSILTAVLSALPFLGWIVGSVIGLVLWAGIGLGGFVLWIMLMYRAYQGRWWELPLVGEQARRMSAGTATQAAGPAPTTPPSAPPPSSSDPYGQPRRDPGPASEGGTDPERRADFG